MISTIQVGQNTCTPPSVEWTGVDMTHDEERLERYLEWRRAEQRDRAARRRRLVGYAAAPALCVIAVGIAAWFGRTSSQPATTATVTAPRPPLAPPPIVELPNRPAPVLPRPDAPARMQGRSRPAPSNGTRPRPPITAPPPAPAERDADSPDLSASVAPLPASPSAIETPSVPAGPPPPTTTAPAGGAVAVAPPTVRERVADWANGEVEEFRAGVKREVKELRSGYEKVRDFFKR